MWHSFRFWHIIKCPNLSKMWTCKWSDISRCYRECSANGWRHTDCTYSSKQCLIQSVTRNQRRRASKSFFFSHHVFPFLVITHKFMHWNMFILALIIPYLQCGLFVTFWIRRQYLYQWMMGLMSEMRCLLKHGQMLLHRQHMPVIFHILWIAR